MVYINTLNIPNVATLGTTYSLASTIACVGGFARIWINFKENFPPTASDTPKLGYSMILL